LQLFDAVLDLRRAPAPATFTETILTKTDVLSSLDAGGSSRQGCEEVCGVLPELQWIA
jgi:hypothetical protein